MNTRFPYVSTGTLTEPPEVGKATVYRDGVAVR
jgi:hypothetical protein